MARKVRKVQDSELSAALHAALDRGAFAPSHASRVIRALHGLSQEDFAAQLGLSLKAIKALESGGGNPQLASLEKVASAAGLRVAFVRPSVEAVPLDPVARAAEERRRRQADAAAIAAGKISERALSKRNALRFDDADFELPSLA